MVDLKKLQNTLLIIANEIKRICDKNSIEYTMIGGTLIGAIRHKGFIPWDDDMDFVMTRMNYDKFLNCCRKDLDDEFFVLNWSTNSFYGDGFTKIMLKDTVAIEKGKENVKYPTNVFVDIFPFDAIPREKRKQRVQKWITYVCIRLLQQKANKQYVYMKGRKRLIYLYLWITSHAFSRDFLIKVCEWQMKKYNTEKSGLLTSITGFYGYDKEIVDEKIFDEYTELIFENTSFKAISRYDEYLKIVFGDYMQLPPVEKRRSHGLVKLNLGKYEEEGDQ